MIISEIRRKAYVIFAKAVKKGWILARLMCEKCGEIGYIDAHHPDYNKPLEVEWLCKSCHQKLHYEKKLAICK